jgi:hypothetical protein
MTIAVIARKTLPYVPLLISLVAQAQNAQLTGSVADVSQASITNATVAIENTITHVKWLAKTNHSGIYVEPSLDPGVYRVSVSAPTFAAQMVEHLKADVGGKLTLNFILHPETQVQSVTVDGSGVQINQTDASVSTVVDRQFVSNIPLNGRSFQSLLASVPGVSWSARYFLNQYL